MDTWVLAHDARQNSRQPLNTSKTSIPARHNPGWVLRDTSQSSYPLDTSVPMGQHPCCIDFPRTYKIRPNLKLSPTHLTVIDFLPISYATPTFLLSKCPDYSLLYPLNDDSKYPSSIFHFPYANVRNIEELPGYHPVLGRYPHHRLGVPLGSHYPVGGTMLTKEATCLEK